MRPMGIEHQFTDEIHNICHKSKKSHKSWNFFVSVELQNWLLVSLTGAGSNTLFADLDPLDKKLEELGITEIDGGMAYRPTSSSK